MNGILFVLVALCAVILVVSLAYIVNNTIHKERMAMIAGGKDPGIIDERSLLNVLKWALLFAGVGLGFLCAFILDTLLIAETNGGEPLYPSMILLGGALGLLMFYKIALGKLRKFKDSHHGKNKDF